MWGLTLRNRESLTWGILKNDTNELIYKTNRLTDIENKLMVTKGKGGGRDKLGAQD